MSVEIAKYSEVLKKACREAGAYIKDNIGKIETVEFKGATDLVTNVDKGSEKIVVDVIKSSFADHAILAEETGASANESDFKWIIDPLDGTTNFAHGFPMFCVSVGLEYKGEIISGGILDPNKDEFFFAEKNAGAFLNGEKIQTTKCDDLKKALLATGFSYNSDRRMVNVEIFKEFLKDVQAIRRPGAAALDLAYVACGRLDGFWEIGLNPWDAAAGCLLVEEAGGKVIDFTGTRFSPYTPYIIATNAFIGKDMLSTINKVYTIGEGF